MFRLFMIQMLDQEILLTISNLRIAYLEQLIQFKYLYSGSGITFESAGLQSFDNDFARNVIIFGVDNSLSTHSDNKFLILGEGPTYSINGSFGS